MLLLKSILFLISIFSHYVTLNQTYLVIETEWESLKTNKGKSCLEHKFYPDFLHI